MRKCAQLALSTISLLLILGAFTQFQTIGIAQEATTPAVVSQEQEPLVPIEIYSPLDWQVFQRRTKAMGEVIVSGSITVDCDKVEVRITGDSPFAPQRNDENNRRGRWMSPSDEWRTANLDKLNHSFSARINTFAGGWYKLEVKATKGDATILEAAVEHVGVGEVFVGAGQSNSTNAGGEGGLTVQTGRVSTFDGSSWRIANDPQPGPHDMSEGGSFWPAFGDAMVEKYNVPVAVAVTGHGGTSVEQWRTDGELFPWMMARMDKLGVNGFRGVIWHQGESDVYMDPNQYYVLMRKLIEDSYKAAGWKFPWFVAKASYHTPESPSFETVRSVQEKLWTDGIAIEGPDTDTIVGDDRDAGGKGIHFSPKGLTKHGQMWAEKISKYLDERLAQEPELGENIRRRQ